MAVFTQLVIYVSEREDLHRAFPSVIQKMWDTTRDLLGPKLLKVTNILMAGLEQEKFYMQ